MYHKKLFPAAGVLTHITSHDSRRGDIREVAHTLAGQSSHGIAARTVAAAAGHTNRALNLDVTADYVGPAHRYDYNSRVKSGFQDPLAPAFVEDAPQINVGTSEVNERLRKQGHDVKTTSKVVRQNVCRAIRRQKLEVWRQDRLASQHQIQDPFPDPFQGPFQGSQRPTPDFQHLKDSYHQIQDSHHHIQDSSTAKTLSALGTLTLIRVFSPVGLPALSSRTRMITIFFNEGEEGEDDDEDKEDKMDLDDTTATAIEDASSAFLPSNDTEEEGCPVSVSTALISLPYTIDVTDKL